MHYETSCAASAAARRRRSSPAETRRREAAGRDVGEELESLERNLGLLRLCDGLSLYVCLNEPGDGEYPPPYPEGFELGERFEPVWDDRHTLRLEPNPFSEPFGFYSLYDGGQGTGARRERPPGTSGGNLSAPPTGAARQLHHLERTR